MREAIIYSLIDHKKLYVHLPDGGRWTRAYLKEILGSSVRLERITDNTGRVWWKVSKTYRDKLSKALQSRYYGVWVIRDYSTKKVCTSSCQRAEEDDCICSCGGEFHGGGGTWTFVKDDLLVGHEVRRVARYFAKESVKG